MPCSRSAEAFSVFMVVHAKSWPCLVVHEHRNGALANLMVYGKNLRLGSALLVKKILVCHNFHGIRTKDRVLYGYLVVITGYWNMRMEVCFTAACEVFS